MTLSTAQHRPSRTIAETQRQMQALIQAWNQADWPQAMRLASQITQTTPQEGLAWKLLGCLYQQQGQLQDALAAFQQAGQRLKKDAEVQINLANTYAMLNQPVLAVKHYRQTLKLEPGMTLAYANWASVRKEAGDLKEAELLLRRGLSVRANDGRLLFELATLLHGQGKYKEAMQYYRSAYAINPQQPVLLFNLAQACEDNANPEEALVFYKQAVTLDAGYVDAWFNLGLLHYAQGQSDAAIQAFETLLTHDPQHLRALETLAAIYKQQDRVRDYERCILRLQTLQPPDATKLNSVAAALINQQLYADAEKYCQQALALDPHNANVYCNLGLIANAKHEFEAAAALFEQALSIAPDSFIVMTNYSVTLRLQGQLTQAKALLERSLEINPHYVGTYINLSNIYLDLGDVAQAIQVVKRIFEFDPDNLTALHNILFYDSYANLLSDEDYMRYARQFGRQAQRQVAATGEAYRAWQVHSEDQRLRIGLVSGDLRQHPVGYFLQNWLSHVDAGQLEIYAYSTDGREDSFTQQLKNRCVQWRSLAGHDDASAAQLIHNDGIHILLDLSGHTSGNRLPMFAWKPAPVQAAWLGYWGTTGIAEMDAVIADAHTLPASARQRFTESIALLPHTRLCFSAPEAEIAVNPLPALTQGFLTFGCFQNFTKVSEEVLALWGRILQALPSAKLRWQCKAFSDAQIQQQALQRLAAHGISAARCTLVGKTSREDYLAAYHAIDMILDSFPFTGGTTTCEALWMGVPTLTLTGHTMIACQGASIMHAAGLPDWVVDSTEAYVTAAIQWAQQLPALAAVRAGLRQKLSDSPLMQGAQFAQDMQTLLFDLWQSHLRTAHAQSHTASQPLQSYYADTPPIWMVSATRMDEATFWQHSALGRSLTRHMQQDARLQPHISFNNTRGLSELFNEAIAQAPDDAILVFVHDDVWLDQTQFGHTLMQGLSQFDVIGLAGNKRRVPAQPGWLFTDTSYTWETAEFVAGHVAHGQDAFGYETHFGPAPAACELMDGVFLAASKQQLVQHQVQFDPRFKFHFYDLDFCRTARNQDLRLGVWPMHITHQSLGAFNSDGWKQTYLMYLDKWQETAFFKHNGTFMTSTDALATPATATPTPAATTPATGASAALKAAIQTVMQEAHTLEQAGDLAQAQAMYQEVLQISPHYAPALSALAQVLQHSGAHAEALLQFEQAVMAEPSNADYWVQYIHSLMQSAEVNDVLQAIELGQQHALSAEQAEALAQAYLSQSPTAQTAAAASQATPAKASAAQMPGYAYHAEDYFYYRPQATAFAYEDIGNAEQRLYQIVKAAQDRSVFSPEFAAQSTDWVSFYHLTPLRANLLRPFADRIAQGKTLELGAGCGAVTRFIGELGGEVVALEGSANRARIIGQRCADLPNVRVFSDLIQDFTTEEQFDVVTLIGVLEYAQVYVKGDQPLQTLLNKAKSFLKPDGILIVAIENQLGLKYFCGANEDHMGQAMYGINDAYSHNTPITFGRRELDALIRSVGFATTELYVPLPDYKTPVSIVYPAGFEAAPRALGWEIGPLAAGSVVHDRQSPQHPTFSLENAWQVIARNDLVQDVANSFMFVAYPQAQSEKMHPQVLAAHYGCQRQAVFSKETQFVHTDQALLTQTRPTGDTATLANAAWETAPYYPGRLWMDQLTHLINRPGWRIEDVVAWAQPWLQALQAAQIATGHTFHELADYPGLLPSAYLDATPANFVMDAHGQGHFFDLEWDFGVPLPIGFVALRGLFLTMHRIRSCAKPRANTPNNLGTLTLAILEQHGYTFSDAQLQAFIHVFNRLQNLTQGAPEHAMNGLTQAFMQAELPVRRLFT